MKRGLDSALKDQAAAAQVRRPRVCIGWQQYGRTQPETKNVAQFQGTSLRRPPCLQEIATKTAALAARDAALARLQQSWERLQQECALDAHHQTSAWLEEALGRAAQLQRQLQVRGREAERMESAVLQERRECDRLRGEVSLWRQLTEA